ncbi:type 1 glutamine amidotransferase [Marichromatium gracile]|uniref:type 1 glutamine amidotransferase n=1 Tax=Marichromatium gracile TaxID=1048 RepID=UPI001F401BCF|nr:type 1 glutamine amidotransferase [Marichromatium gracile]MCF1182986.1 type 1 glutamine amidotransferase [Marichromatium gracile]
MMNAPMRVCVLQHVPFEGPGAIGDWVRARGHALQVVRLDLGEPLPTLAEIDWLVVMGGPMGVDQEQRHPWLATERAFISRAIGADKTLIGICLGAQQIAAALGARVCRNPEREIGWFPLELRAEGRASGLFAALPEGFEVFHWHGDTFALPEGAQPLAASAACTNQGFLFEGRVLGLQCHLEATTEGVERLLVHCADELTETGPFVQSPEHIRAQPPEHYARLHQALFALLDRMVELGREL